MRNQVVGIILLWCFCFYAVAGYVSHSATSNTLTIVGDEETFTLSAYKGDAIEVVYDSRYHKQLPSYAIAPDAASSVATVSDSEKTLRFSSGELTAVVDKQSLSVRFEKANELLILQSGFNDTETGLGFTFAIDPQEKLLGGGQRIKGMDRRGHKFPLYNKAHYGYTTDSTQMYYGLPAIMSSKKYMLLFDNSATGEMDLDSQNNNTLSFSAVSGRASYIVVAGNSYPDLIENYVGLTGKQSMPPRWALGNFASRFGYRNQQEVYDVVERFEQEDMPLDALVLDLYWFGKDIQGHMGNLAWDREAFPEPEKMIADLQGKGVNTVVITEPFILSTSKRWQEAVDSKAIALNESGEPYRFDFYFGNTGLVDVFNEDGRSWFAEAYQRLDEQGVTGWWGDLGEPEVQPDDILHRLDDGTMVRGDAIHNVYGHKWAEMVYQESVSLQPTKRPMIMMRSGFLGSQRYGLIPWTGDVSRSWGGLEPQVELSLQMSLFGLAYTHSDLGGFAGGEQFDAEMYTRWLQYGVFQPVYRPHAQEQIAPEPVFHDSKTKDIVREFIKLRYRLMPYTYSLAYQNAVSGMPLMRPLMFEDESNISYIDEKNSYLWGDAFLVTPVIEPGVRAVNVNVPNGVWFDYWTGEKIQGGQQLDIPVSLETIPVLVRAGSFIPMVNTPTNEKHYNTEKLALHYYFDATVKGSQGMFYDDDGISAQSLSSQHYQKVTFTAENSDNGLGIAFNSQGKGYAGMPKTREITLSIHNWPLMPTLVSFDARDIPVVASEQALDLATQAAFWDTENQQLHVKFDYAAGSKRLLIK
ncbi:TIM-barrel domain-containing protein [Thalassotalea euphylliae]|uniref:TIM-barrel domain-containing protein n=1 Tax=Thalassotalea euphylliae TaxID=1655234 RepID=UPI00362F1DBE